MSARRLMLRLGTSCDNACRHCTIGDLAGLPERSTDEALAALRQGREKGCDELALMRGEPTLRADLEPIVRGARALGYRHVQVQTNGRTLSAAGRAADLAAAGVTHFEISLYGPDAAVHDAVAGVAGAFAETRRGIEQCAAAGLELMLTIPVVAANAHRLAETVACAARLGARTVQLNFTRPLAGREDAVSSIAEAAPQVRGAVLLGRALGLSMFVEALPPCVLGGVEERLIRFDPTEALIVDLHRTTPDLRALRRRYRPHGRACGPCAKAESCPTTWRGYLEMPHGQDWLQPFPGSAEPKVDLCLLHPPWTLVEAPPPRQWDLLSLLPDAAPSALEADAASEFGPRDRRAPAALRALPSARYANLAGLYTGAADAYARISTHVAGLRAELFAIAFDRLPQCQGALELAALCRRLHPGARTALVGRAASQLAPEIFARCPEVDLIAAALPIDALRSGGRGGEAPGAWLRREDCAGRDLGPRTRGAAMETAWDAAMAARELLASSAEGERVQLDGEELLSDPFRMRPLLDALKSAAGGLTAVVEIRQPHPEAELRALSRAFRELRLVFRPGSGDEGVRRRGSTRFSNRELLDCIAAATRQDNAAVELAVAFGLAGDDARSLESSLELLRRAAALGSPQRPVLVRFEERWWLEPGAPEWSEPERWGYRVDWRDLPSLARGFAAPLFSGAVHFAPASLTRRGYIELLLRQGTELNRLLVEAGQRASVAARSVSAYLDTVAEFLDPYEQLGPGGAGAPRAAQDDLGRAMVDAFIARALGAPGPRRARASPAKGPSAAADHRDLLGALGLADRGDVRVSSGGGELRLELGEGKAAVMPAGSGRQPTARTDAFDLVGDPAACSLLQERLRDLERRRPEEISLVCAPMQERVSREEGQPGEKAEELVRVTLSCNQRCLFCSVDPSRERAQAPDEVRAFIRRRAGGPFIVFSGGEPTLDSQLPTYLQLARDAGYPEIAIQTNGLRCAYPAYARRLRESGLRSAFVSLCSHRAEVSDALTRTPGSFELTLRGVDALLANDVAVWLNFVATARNVSKAEAFVEFAHGRFPGLAGICLSVMAPVGVGAGARSLWPRLERAGRHLGAALDAAARLGLPIKVPDVCGLPLCHLPGRERFSEALRALPSDASSRDRAQAAACRSCRWHSRCGGYWRSYLREHGEAELVPQPPPAAESGGRL